MNCKFAYFEGMRSNGKEETTLFQGVCEKELTFWTTRKNDNLGITFRTRRKRLSFKIFKKDEIRCKEIINHWSMRGLSLFGKVTIIKTFLIPKLLWYITEDGKDDLQIFVEGSRQSYKEFSNKHVRTWRVESNWHWEADQSFEVIAAHAF